MITLTHPSYAPIIVLGHSAAFNGQFYDLRDDDWLDEMLTDFGHKDFCVCDEGDGCMACYRNSRAPAFDLMSEAQYINHFAKTFLPAEENSEWGDNEPYADHSQNPNVEVRVLAAKNAMHLDLLADDESELVRTAAASVGDKSVLDKLVCDKSKAVRLEIAKRGISEYLDKLVSDESHEVRTAVARCGEHKHHLALLGDSSFVVAYALSCAISADSVHLIDFDAYSAERGCENKSVSNNIARNIAKRGLVEHLEPLARHKSALVKIELAKRGLFLDVLTKDSNEHIRAACALGANGAAYHEQLACDESRHVRLAVARVCEPEILAAYANEDEEMVKREVTARLRTLMAA